MKKILKKKYADNYDNLGKNQPLTLSYTYLKSIIIDYFVNLLRILQLDSLGKRRRILRIHLIL